MDSPSFFLFFFLHSKRYKFAWAKWGASERGYWVLWITFAMLNTSNEHLVVFNVYPAEPSCLYFVCNPPAPTLCSHPLCLLEYSLCGVFAFYICVVMLCRSFVVYALYMYTRTVTIKSPASGEWKWAIRVSLMMTRYQ